MGHRHLLAHAGQGVAAGLWCSHENGLLEPGFPMLGRLQVVGPGHHLQQPPYGWDTLQGRS